MQPKYQSIGQNLRFGNSALFNNSSNKGKSKDILRAARLSLVSTDYIFYFIFLMLKFL
jgi:hypothetical protein